MKIILTPRQSGKTTKAIEWLRKDNNRVLIVSNIQELNRLQNTYKDVADRITTLTGYDNFRGCGMWDRIREVGIDNADYILQNMVDNPITFITMTKDNKKS